MKSILQLRRLFLAAAMVMLLSMGIVTSSLRGTGTTASEVPHGPAIADGSDPTPTPTPTPDPDGGCIYLVCG
ncbi:MAG: hypothetical protein H6638_14030 [Ardenticatenales bacterium]|nr:hypothetical protein [Ardenticatenales bacterium]